MKFDYSFLITILQKLKKKHDLDSLEEQAIAQVVDDYQARLNELKEIREHFRNEGSSD